MVKTTDTAKDVLLRVEETLETAKLGLADLHDPSRARRMAGLRNLIAFGRSVTFVLQNLRSVTSDFDEWYAPHVANMKQDPLMRYFVEARNALEKQGRVNVMTSTHVHNFSPDMIRSWGRPPVGAVAFFMGDQLGGSGWEVQLADGRTEKYYVEVPTSVAEVKQHFFDLPDGMSSELKDAPIEDLCSAYMGRLTALVDEAKAHFLGLGAPTAAPVAGPEKKPLPPYLRVIK